MAAFKGNPGKGKFVPHEMFLYCKFTNLSRRIIPTILRTNFNCPAIAGLIFLGNKMDIRVPRYDEETKTYCAKVIFGRDFDLGLNKRIKCHESVTHSICRILVASLRTPKTEEEHLAYVESYAVRIAHRYHSNLKELKWHGDLANRIKEYIFKEIKIASDNLLF